MTDDENDDRTPREQRPPTSSERIAYFVDHPPGTPVAAEMVPTPRSAFEVKIDERTAANERDLASLLASRRMWRWIIGLGAPVVLSAFFGLIIYSADKIEANAERVGGTAAEIKSLVRQIESLEGEIKELRAVLLKISGISGRPLTFVQYQGDFNDSSILHLDRPARRFLFADRSDARSDARPEVRVRPNLLDESGLQRLLRRLPLLQQREVRRDAPRPADL